MKKLFFIFLILLACKAKTQDSFLSERKEALEIIKQLNFSYTNKEKNINDFFTEVVVCSICQNNNAYENEFIFKNKEFIEFNLDEAMKFLKYDIIQNKKLNFTKNENSYVLSYQTAKSNKKTGFEGASALVTFKEENGSLKIYSIETIP